MNIFVVSPSPEVCAQVLDDKRVVKMVLETCQLLSTAMNESGGRGPYKSTHVNHPCSIWTRASFSNYLWLHNHFQALLNEYTKRYGKIHKCQQYVFDLAEGVRYVKLGEMTEFPNCTTFKDISNVYEAYGKYLQFKWKNDKRVPTWNRVKRINNETV